MGFGSGRNHGALEAGFGKPISREKGNRADDENFVVHIFVVYIEKQRIKKKQKGEFKLLTK